MLDQLLPVLGAGGLGAVVLAVVNALINRKKLGAEATQILTQAAGGLVERLQAQAAEQRAVEIQLRERIEKLEEANRAKDERIDGLEDEVRRAEWKHEDELREVKRVLQEHVPYDTLAAANLAKHGIHLGEVPPLWPENL